MSVFFVVKLKGLFLFLQFTQHKQFLLFLLPMSVSLIGSCQIVARNQLPFCFAEMSNAFLNSPCGEGVL